MSRLLAIDHGGTTTRAIAMAPSGHIIWRGDDRSLYHAGERRKLTWEEHVSRMMEAINEKIGGRKYDGIIAAINGMNSDQEVWSAERALRLQTGTGNIRVVNDCVAAFRGCELRRLANGVAVLLCAGSGLNCVMGTNGKDIHSLGWRIGARDQGGYAIGRRIWDAVLDDFNGMGKPTMLSKMLLEYYARDEMGVLISDVSSGRLRFEPENLTPLLLAAARDNDAVASGIITELSDRWLGYLRVMLNERLIGAATPVRLYLSGGLFMGEGNPFVKTLINMLPRMPFRMNFHIARFPPVVGAALLLLDSQYGELREDVFDEFLRSGESPRDEGTDRLE